MDQSTLVAFCEQHLYSAKLESEMALTALECRNFSEALRHAELASMQNELAIKILHE